MTTKRKLALVIGCSYIYSNPPIPQLHGTCNDARNIAIFLKQNCGYRNENIILMTDDDVTIRNTDRYPTRNNIFNQIRNILNRAQSTDEVCMFYAGHGTQQRAGSENVEEVDGLNEVLVPTDYNIKTGANAIADDTMNALLKQFGKTNTRVLLIFDCCHSGTMCDLKYTYNYSNSNKSFIKNVTPDPPFDKSLDISFAKKQISSTVIALSGSRDNEVSAEDVIKYDGSNTKEGILTSAFIYAIKTNPASTRDIFGIVRDMYIHTSPYKQQPLVSSNIDLMTSDAMYRCIFDGAQYITVNNNVNVKPKKKPIDLLPYKLPTQPTKNINIPTNATSSNVYAYKSLNAVDMLKYIM